MKSMLIAAASVGVVIAGLILYMRRSNSSTRLLSGTNEKPAQNELGRAQYAMG